MKKIVLNTAQVDNSGKRRQAGETVTVGKGDAAIDADRAKKLVSDRLAIAVKAPARRKPAAKPKAKPAPTPAPSSPASSNAGEAKSETGAG